MEPLQFQFASAEGASQSSRGPALKEQAVIKGAPLKPHIDDSTNQGVPASIPCTFVFPTRKKAAGPVHQVISHVESQNSWTQVARESESPPLSPMDGKWTHAQPEAAAAIHTAPNKSDASPYSENFGPLPTSSSTGTFGGLRRSRARSNVSNIITSPVSEGFHITGRTRTTNLSPLSQSFVPAKEPSSNAEYGSDASNDSPAISTPADIILHPCLSKEMANLPSPELDTTVIGEERSSLFSVSAYEREDNAVTPMLGKTLSNSPRLTGYSPSPPPFSTSLQDNLPAPVLRESLDSHHHSIIPSESTSSTLRRTNRPAPLILNPNNNPGAHVIPESYQRLDRSSVDSGSRKSSTSHGPASPLIPAVEYVKTIQIQLWIDQEDHRTIRPTFAFKRHTAQQGSRMKSNPLRPSTAQNDPAASKSRDRFWASVTDSGLVDLRMIAKEVGVFHCGKLSREATIRRLVVDGNDEKDYLSCNVVLPLGENGVYTVYGVEQEKGKGPGRSFAWKFEYTVEDKRKSQSAQIRDGEKLLRPISFICSPEMLSPSQASNVSIMHLLAKKLTPSPSATRIPPPSMPLSTPPASATASEISVFSESSFLSSLTRKSRIGGVVKTVSRPTTPATDRRLRSGSESKRSSIGSNNFSGAMSLGRKDQNSGERCDGGLYTGTPTTIPSFQDDNIKKSSMLSGLPSSRSKDSALRQFHKPSRVSRSHFGIVLPRRPHTSDASSKRPQTSTHSIGKSVKQVGDTLFGKARTSKRPATAGHSHRSSPLLDSRVIPRSKRIESEIVAHVAPWRMPTEDEINATLTSISIFVRKEHKRLDMLARSHNAKDTTIERLDSSEGLSMPDRGPSTPVRSIESNLMGRQILSPKTLDHWAMPSSLGAFRRPSTAHSVSPSTGSYYEADAQSNNFTSLQRPGTTDGLSPFDSEHSFRNASTTSLGLPLPPRRPCTPGTKLT